MDELSDLKQATGLFYLMQNTFIVHELRLDPYRNMQSHALKLFWSNTRDRVKMDGNRLGKTNQSIV